MGKYTASFLGNLIGSKSREIIVLRDEHPVTA
jgi:hypothetical protein